MDATVSEFWQQWSEVAFLPAPPGFSQDFFATLLHFQDYGAGPAGQLMASSPNEQIQKHRGQVDSLLRQPVVCPSSVSFVRLGNDDSRCLKLLQSIAEDIRGDTFARFLKLLEGAEAAHHQIADNQERPAVSEDLKGDTDGAAGTLFGLGLAMHGNTLINVTCIMQAILRAGDDLSHPVANCATRVGYPGGQIFG